MTGADLQLSLLTIRSIILKCVNIPVGGELYRHNILVLTSLVQLHCTYTTVRLMMIRTWSLRYVP